MDFHDLAQWPYLSWLSLKVPVPKSLENKISFKLADMVTFHSKTSSIMKNLQIYISFVSILKKQCLCYLLFYKWWPRFLISKRVFRWFLLNYITDFAHKISHIKPSKYDSSFGTKISICLKKVGGMRLWIVTSTFDTCQ